jgi:DNA-binding NarL/FixJ family response regulator
MAGVRILIADDHDVVRQGVRRILELERGWTVCGEATNGREAVALAVTLQPDIVVLDVSMSELNGVEVARRVKKLVPGARILILTMHDVDTMIADALKAGAHGYVLKSDSGREIVSAIQSILAGRTYVSKRLRDSDVTDAGKPRGRSLDLLTGREREVLQLLTEGRANKEIAALLGISPKTAETHRARMMVKLGVHSIGELVRYAVRNRIIEP